MSQIIPDTIRGLTLQRPWPVAFDPKYFNPAKLGENRTWAPPAGTDWLALHAGKAIDANGASFMLSRLKIGTSMRGYSEQAERLQSCIFAVCRLDKVLLDAKFKDLPSDQIPWAFGPYLWLMKDMVLLNQPVLCGGAQGLWSVQGKGNGILDRLRIAYTESLGVASNLKETLL